MKGLEFQKTLQVTFCKEIKTSETKYLPPIFFHSKTETVVNDSDIDKS